MSVGKMEVGVNANCTVDTHINICCMAFSILARLIVALYLISRDQWLFGAPRPSRAPLRTPYSSFSMSA